MEVRCRGILSGGIFLREIQGEILFWSVFLRRSQGRILFGDTFLRARQRRILLLSDIVQEFPHKEIPKILQTMEADHLIRYQDHEIWIE